MITHQAFRFELDPNDQMSSALSSHCGASRFAYNTMLSYVCWALDARAFEARTTGSPTTQVPWNLYALRKEWNEIKCDIAPWWQDNSKEAYNSGLDALGRALSNFSSSRKGLRRGSKVGFPKYKKRGSRQSFRYSTGSFGVVDDRHVKLARIGVIRVKERTTKLIEQLDANNARILSCTISKSANRWFIAFGCEVERNDVSAHNFESVVGVDLGIRHLATLSTGEVIANPKPLQRYQRRMARLQRELSRRHNGSKRRARTKVAISRQHVRIANIRNDAIAKATTNLARNYASVVIEDLNVVAMTSSPKRVVDPHNEQAFLANGKRAKAGLNRSLSDVSFGEFRRRLIYKMGWRQGRLIVADRYYPSSKTCSSCKQVKTKLDLARSTYRCDCGLEIDRDLNAAINLGVYGHQVVAGSGPETQTARGGGHPRIRPKPLMKREDGTEKSGQTVTVSSQGEAA